MILLSLLLLAAAPAAPPADLTAFYAVKGGDPQAALKVEVSRSGNFRVDLPGDSSIVRRDGHTYMITETDSSPVVTDVADIRLAASEETAKRGAALCRSLARKAAEATMVRAGTATVAGRTGDAWFKGNPAATPGATPALVVSHDPALAPLGPALLEHYRATVSMLPDCPEVQAMLAPMAAAIATGTPIAMGIMELTEVREGPIDPSRFNLPGPVRSLEQMRSVARSMKTYEPRPTPAH